MGSLPRQVIDGGMRPGLEPEGRLPLVPARSRRVQLAVAFRLEGVAGSLRFEDRDEHFAVLLERNTHLHPDTEQALQAARDLPWRPRNESSASVTAVGLSTWASWEALGMSTRSACGRCS